MTNIEKTLAEIAAYQKQIEENMLKIQRNQERTDAQLAKTDAQLAATEARFAAQNAKSDLKLKETKEMLSNIGFNLGATAEEFFIMR